MNSTTAARLREHYLFSALDEAQFTRLTPAIKPVSVSADQHLFHFGDSINAFFLVCTGHVQLYRLAPNGEEKVIDIIQPGQSFAEALMFSDIGVYPVSAKAISDSELVSINMDAFRELVQQSTGLCLRLLGDMSRRLHNAVQEIERLTLQNASMRVIHFLLQAAPDSSALNYELQLETPKHILASRLSVRPETFSRILQQLSRKGLIRVQGKSVLVLDAVGLRAVLSYGEVNG